MSRLPSLLALLVVVSACSEPPIGPSPTSLSPSADVVLSAASITPVMTGLNSPRGLDFGPEGGLYVTEAGTAQQTGGCIQFYEGPTLSTKCYSGTGSVSRLWKGEQTRIVTGLPSTYIVQSSFASGPQDISFAGRGRAMIAIGWGGVPSQRAVLAEAARAAGTLAQLEPSGNWRVVADVSAFEESTNPAGGIVDSNPYGVLAEGGRTFVVDAGGNSLLEVAANGKISLVAIFPTTLSPPFPASDAVPTRVNRGPDGALYVSTLSGVPFRAGTAAIYRVVQGQPPTVYLGGFKTITDFAFAPDGSVYVLQFATSPVFFGGPGALIHVATNGVRSIVTTSLTQPTGVVVGPDGSVFVSNRGTSAGGGEVLRIRP
ncbi:MAG: ScyD/ScyE family protein [Gemmatimonadaceae bacterium]